MCVSQLPRSGAREVAVVGSGISGLATAWLLNHNGVRVTLFEKEDRLGGHTFTTAPGSTPVPVDVGFQVFNFTNYPHLAGFFEALGVDSEPSDMSFALSLDQGKLEWSSKLPFVQGKNLWSPTFLSFLADVVRFKKASEVLDTGKLHIFGDMTVGEYVTYRRFSNQFVDWYLVPMCAAIWSCAEAAVLELPIRNLIQFWHNHGLLNLRERPTWRVVRGRSQSYVDKVIESLQGTGNVQTGAEVVALERSGPGVTLRVKFTASSDVKEFQFDDVVLATHTDVSLRILGEAATTAEEQVLGAIPYTANQVYVHSDRALMPKDERAWASWNYLGTTQSASSKATVGRLAPSLDSVCVSYWCNLLQNLPEDVPPIFVTLNPPTAPDPSLTYSHHVLSHPAFSFKAMEAQKRVHELQGQHNVWFAGAWCTYGFHEDGIASAVNAVISLTGRKEAIPWVPRSLSHVMPWTHSMCLRMFDTFAKNAIKTGGLRVVLPNGNEMCYGTYYGDEGGLRLAPDNHCQTCMRILDSSALARFVYKSDIGLGEAYMLGDIHVDPYVLMKLLTTNARQSNAATKSFGLLNRIGQAAAYAAHCANDNSESQSRINIAAHYDAGNEMYASFLDKTMMYSCAVHSDVEKEKYAHGYTSTVEELEAAQLRKLDLIIERAGIKKGDRVLEIGCGWGAFAIRAAQTKGCHVVGITLSKEQLAEANERVTAAGLQDNIELRLIDYRKALLPHEENSFDCVVSIEMLEAVGHAHIHTYMEMLRMSLKPSGIAVVQVISIPDDRYSAYRKSSDFIRAHIFPGGHLPCLGVLKQAAAAEGIKLLDCLDIGYDYALTLRVWRKRFLESKKKNLDLGYSEEFVRKYDFYFAYCEAAFEQRYLHDFILTWEKSETGPSSGMLGAAMRGISKYCPGWPTGTSMLCMTGVFALGVYMGRMSKAD